MILDEIGRGTSTFDGISLAWAITEHIHDAVGCRTLFATHYHELVELEKTKPRLRNANVAVRESEGEIVFLHRIVPGGADQSYGIHVARLAGVPAPVLDRAREILAFLEKQHGPDPGPPPSRARSRKVKTGRALPGSLFAALPDPLLDELRRVDPASLTPEQAVRPGQEAARAGGVRPAKSTLVMARPARAKVGWALPTGGRLSSDVLAAGPVPAAEVKAAATKAGISPKTQDHAKANLWVRSPPRGFGCDVVYAWKLRRRAPWRSMDGERDTPPLHTILSGRERVSHGIHLP